MGFFCDMERRDEQELFPGVRAKTFWGDNMLISMLELDASVHVPRHSHPHEQLGTVFEGTFEMTIGDQTRTLGPGDAYIIPGNVEHSVTVGDKPVKAMDVFSPVREEYT